MMMDQSRVESTRDTYNYGQYINQLHRTPTTPNTIKVIQIQKCLLCLMKFVSTKEMLRKYTYYKHHHPAAHKYTTVVWNANVIT